MLALPCGAADTAPAAYAPAYLTNVLVFAHINFATHKTNADGSTEIINLNHNMWYKTVNFFGSGVYFHKNHHVRPNLYDPSTLVLAPFVVDQMAPRWRKNRTVMPRTTQKVTMPWISTPPAAWSQVIRRLAAK